ncbi:MAG: flagellar basal-body rod protein FlgF [Deltaproteobacteria bacterium]|nr:flagellar basal-body rod protein FlgF [Deltaproteobacteria bacterium]
MDRGVSAAVSGLIAQTRAMETITNNLANVNTPGYKKDQLRFKAVSPIWTNTGNQHPGDVDITKLPAKPGVFLNYVASDQTTKPGDVLEATSLEPPMILSYEQYCKVAGTDTFMHQGTLKDTGQPLDLALNGKGFFNIQTPNGNLYTRAGNFTRSAQGQLVTRDGNQVLGKNGQPIDINPQVAGQPGSVHFDNEGAVYVDGARVADLDIVDFKQPYRLVKKGQDLVAPADPEDTPTPVDKPEVHEGMLEQSNVSTVTEMTNMIETQRVFEAYQKVMQSYDETYSSVISDVGRSVT